MNEPKVEARYESILLRVLWMLVFVLVWQVAQFILGAVVLVQLVYRADRPFRQLPQRPETLAVCRLANPAHPGRRGPAHSGASTTSGP
jgi:hypothetical protein